MDKIIIVINGQGGVGKDTLCDFAGEIYRCMNISSIAPIKEIASKYAGWNGQRDLKSRKFLSDLKILFSEYNDLPFQYMKKCVEEFLKSDNIILFVHIRERLEIKKFIDYVHNECEVKCVSLLIRRGEIKVYGNVADDDIHDEDYDYIYYNDLTLSEVPENFYEFIEFILDKENFDDGWTSLKKF